MADMRMDTYLTVSYKIFNHDVSSEGLFILAIGSSRKGQAHD